MKRSLLVLILLASPAPAQNSNQITAVSPTSAAQGTTNQLVTFTLDSDIPPPPPAGIAPTSVTLGTLTGTAVTHSSQYTVTAKFTIPAAEAIGWKDAAIVFPGPNGTLTFSKASAFQITAGSGVAAAFTATPTSGTVPLTVSFTDSSTGSITNRLWTFGDGSTSTATSPTHTYTTTGGFTVTLIVTGPAGSNTLTRTNYINVTTVPNPGDYTVVDTGQTQCYNATTTITAPAPSQAFYGQDAQCAGVQPSYSLSTDGLTVYDNRTRLTWQRSPDTSGDGTITATDKLTWTNAQARPAVLNAARFGGFSDWRLPSIKELYSLIDFRGTDPSGLAGSDTSALTPFIDTSFFKFAYGQTSAGERIIDSQYASANLYVSTALEQSLFGVNFADGRIKGYGLTIGGTDKTFFVQCVRGNTNYGTNLFVDNGDQTITDRATSLMWTKGDSGSGMNWADALAWAQTKNAANFLGHNDWRLPNAKELQSIVDYTRCPDTTASAAIAPVFSCTAITNEKGQADFPWYWTATTHATYAGSANTGAYVCFGRAMGYMNSSWVDVHGAGCQRSDPKGGSLSSYTYVSNGYYNAIAPQGDAVRLYNYVRLVRDTVVAAFTATPTGGSAPLAVTFSDTSTGSIANRHWDFGDGATLDTAATSIAHTYQIPGTFTITLTVNGPSGTDTKSSTNLVTAISLDTVGDGIPDWWRAHYFGGDGKTSNANSAASGDSDHDGIANLDEYLADTNPTDPISYFHISNVTLTTVFSVSFQSSANRSYTLYFTANLASGVWTAVPSQSHITGSGGVDSLTDPSPAGTIRFYRIGADLP